ncbi:MAG: hypothetical protein JWM59_52 [Verrucomicrobiales bacterium]|nr:hypothetical protein [Verrucomicrobiales bacterium]
MAMAAIGLERHRLRTGKWPASLQEAAGLIPGGLRPVPSLGTPVIYTRLPDGGGWRLAAGRNTPPWIMPERVE